MAGVLVLPGRRDRCPLSPSPGCDPSVRERQWSVVALDGRHPGAAAWQACFQLGQQPPARRRCDAARLHRRLARCRPPRHWPVADLRPGLGGPAFHVKGRRACGERLAVTLGPAAKRRLLRARPCGRCAPPATRRRVPPCSAGSPARRLPAAFTLPGGPDGPRVARDGPPVSRRRGVDCSGPVRVPGVMDRLKGRRGPTIFLAEEPKTS